MTNFTFEDTLTSIVLAHVRISDQFCAPTRAVDLAWRILFSYWLPGRLSHARPRL